MGRTPATESKRISVASEGHTTSAGERNSNGLREGALSGDVLDLVFRAISQLVNLAFFRWWRKRLAFYSGQLDALLTPARSLDSVLAGYGSTERLHLSKQRIR